MLAGEIERHTLAAPAWWLAYRRKADAARHAMPRAASRGHGRSGPAPRGRVTALNVATISPTPSRASHTESAIRMARADAPAWRPGGPRSDEQASCTSVPPCLPGSRPVLLTQSFHKLPAVASGVK